MSSTESDSSDDEDNDMLEVVRLVMTLLRQWQMSTLALAHASSVFMECDGPERKEDYSVNPLYPKMERLRIAMDGNGSLLRNTIGMYPAEFEALCAIVVPQMENLSRQSGEQKKKWKTIKAQSARAYCILSSVSEEFGRLPNRRNKLELFQDISERRHALHYRCHLHRNEK